MSHLTIRNILAAALLAGSVATGPATLAGTMGAIGPRAVAGVTEQYAFLKHGAGLMRRVNPQMVPCRPGKGRFTHVEIWSWWAFPSGGGFWHVTGGYYQWVPGLAVWSGCGTGGALDNQGWQQAAQLATIGTASAYQYNGGCANCVVLPDPVQGTVQVDQFSLKGKPLSHVATLTNPFGLTPFAATVDSDSTIYASAIGPSGQYGLLAYPLGATQPTVLGSSAPAGQIDGGVALDSAHNVYWAVSENDQCVVQKYAPGSTQPQSIVLHNTSPSAGAIAIDKNNNIIVTSPDMNQIRVFDQSGNSLRSIPTPGIPTSISLTKDGTILTVVDAVNETISDYSYPKGKLLRSGPVDDPTAVLGAVTNT